MSARIDIGRRAETLGNGRQCYPFREQLTVAVVEGVHGIPLKVLVRLRFGLFFRGFGVIRQIQRAFLATGCNKTSDRDKRSKRRDQALHGEILCKSINCARVYRPPGSLPMRGASRLAGLGH
ncbi:hypothetical protein KPSA1_00022 [Pseudomonas syringae pv. actinidiae]|uniref:Uncharacterized protein n=1 Tax=Pseudomonas syringae pv. actinidiae TaxID=103796 RepID=A0A2V0Q310_PSESF|nr:hypothetical protein KPSA1_00022 [Pseudomonas syringae pv. actinidiae]